MEEPCVYWIRHKDHIDIFSQGYVGITSRGLGTRMIQHRKCMRDGNTYPVYAAMRKYGSDIVINKVVIGSLDYCLLVEKALRPEQRIGWNIAIGGVATQLGARHSEESRKKMSDSCKGRKLTAEHKEIISKAHKGRKYPKEFAEACRQRAIAQGGFSKQDREKACETNRNLPPWRNPHACAEVWLLAEDVYIAFQDNNRVGVRTLGKMFNMSYGKFLVILKKIRAGWIPLEDPLWLNFKSK